MKLYKSWIQYYGNYIHMQLNIKLYSRIGINWAQQIWLA